MCVILFCIGHSGDRCLSVSILFKYESRIGQLFVLSLARVRGVALCSVVCDLIILYVFHVCFD